MKQTSDWKDQLKALKDRLDKIPTCKLTLEGEVYQNNQDYEVSQSFVKGLEDVIHEESLIKKSENE